MQITLIEAKDVLSSFDKKLRAYTERLIKKRKSMKIVKAFVTSVCTTYVCATHLLIINYCSSKINMHQFNF